MAQKRKYKRVEKNIAKNVLGAFGQFFKMIGRFFANIFRVGDRKLTIMIVPHSQSKVVNIQTNLFSLILGFVLIAGIVGSFFFFNTKAVGSTSEIARLMEENRQTLASLD